MSKPDWRTEANRRKLKKFLVASGVINVPKWAKKRIARGEPKDKRPCPCWIINHSEDEPFTKYEAEPLRWMAWLGSRETTVDRFSLTEKISGDYTFIVFINYWHAIAYKRLVRKLMDEHKEGVS